MRYQSTALAALGVLVAGCAQVQVNVSEAVLSTNQKVAMVSTPGDSVSPPTNLVLLSDRHGQYTPVATGFGQAPVPAFLSGAGAGVAVGAGIYGAAKVAKPQVTNISSTNTGGNTNGTNTSTNTTASTSTSAGNSNTSQQVQQSSQQSNIQVQNAIASKVQQGAGASNTAGP
jgi:hypothetical protein